MTVTLEAVERTVLHVHAELAVGCRAHVRQTELRPADVEKNRLFIQVFRDVRACCRLGLFGRRRECLVGRVVRRGSEKPFLESVSFHLMIVVLTSRHRDDIMHRRRRRRRRRTCRLVAISCKRSFDQMQRHLQVRSQKTHVRFGDKSAHPRNRRSPGELDI